MKFFTYVTDRGGEVKLNYTGNPGMTVGGTGDVLAGIYS
jgi:NAD(P)H-hydrate epimerase